jgi:hypothetical protein
MLELVKDGQVIETVPPGSMFRLPNGDFVSPAHVGWTNGEYELVEKAPPPFPTPEQELTTERAGMSLTFAQMLIGLVREGWITEQQGEAWLVDRQLPATFAALISTMPSGQRFEAKARAIQPSVILRNDPIVSALAALEGKTQEQLDGFFRTYAQV